MNISILGTGYVGLVSAACFADMGNTVWCVDINPGVVNSLRNGNIHIFEPGLEDLVRRNTAEKRLRFTTQIEEALDDAECVFIAVGTPARQDGSCDLSFVENAAANIGRCMKQPLIVVNKSTVPVGTADRVRAIIAHELAAKGVEIAFDVVSNPEFLKEGAAVEDFMKPDRVVIGTDNPESVAILRELYAPYARKR